MYVGRNNGAGRYIFPEDEALLPASFHMWPLVKAVPSWQPFLPIQQHPTTSKVAGEGALEKYPQLAAFTKAFAARPEIAAYLTSDRRVPLTKVCTSLRQGLGLIIPLES